MVFGTRLFHFADFHGSDLKETDRQLDLCSSWFLLVIWWLPNNGFRRSLAFPPTLVIIKIKTFCFFVKFQFCAINEISLRMYVRSLWHLVLVHSWMGRNA